MLFHDVPSRPWPKISVALFQLHGKHYLVMVDHYSDYFELDSLRSTTASAVIQAMKRNFVVTAYRMSALDTMDRSMPATSIHNLPGIKVFWTHEFSPYYNQEYLEEITSWRPIPSSPAIQKRSSTRPHVFISPENDVSEAKWRHSYGCKSASTTNSLAELGSAGHHRKTMAIKDAVRQKGINYRAGIFTGKHGFTVMWLKILRQDPA